MSLTVLKGAAAGAAGSTALNAVTYLDMAVRGRGASDTPQQTVDTLADEADLAVPGEGATRDDLVPHLIYGLVTYATLAKPDR